MEVEFYGTLKVLAIVHDRYSSMMRNYLKEVKFEKAEKALKGLK